MNNNPDEALEQLATRACLDRWFLGAALAAYQRRHYLDDAGLAATLGCAPDLLTHLRLCRCPGIGEPDRTQAEDIAAIAGRFGLDATILARVLEDA
jgi:hypothetical protein